MKTPRSSRIILFIAATFFISFLVYDNLFVQREPNFDEIDQAYEAINMQDYAKTAQIAEPMAIDGNERAQYYMGILEAFGLGRPINRSQAKDWFARTSGRRSRGELECYIAKAFVDGDFMVVNIEEAKFWVAYAEVLRQTGFCNVLLGNDFPDELTAG